MYSLVLFDFINTFDCRLLILVSFGSNLRGALRKQHSRSLDNLTSRMEDGTSEVELMTRDQLEGLVRLVKNIMGIQSYMQTLQNAMMWECLGNQRSTPKSNLKSK